MPQHTLSNAGSRISTPSFTCGRDPGRFVRKRAKWKGRTHPHVETVWFELDSVDSDDSEPASSFSGSAFAFVRKGERRGNYGPTTKRELRMPR